MHKIEIQNSNYWVTEDHNSSQHEGVVQGVTILMTNDLSQDTQGRGTRHVVYWNHNVESGGQSLKVNPIVYDNNVLQVTILIKYSIVTVDIMFRFKDQVFSCGSWRATTGW